MSLSEKLERAKKQRLLEAGLLPSSEALKPEPTSTVVADPVWTPIEVEVQPIGLHSVVDDAEDERFFNSVTTTHHCPSCHAAGRVDMVDLIGHRTHLTCTHCGAMWQVTSADVEQR